MTTWNKTVVAIDGPAGSGKSSVSRAAAELLDFGFLDTGAGYRALTWLALDHGIDTESANEVLGLFRDFDYSNALEPGESRVLVGSIDVTAAIREPRVTSMVSAVARVPEVRVRLNDLYRSLINEAATPGVVAEGRDITTVVAPDAAVRILLTASEQVRMARRSAELPTASPTDVAQQLASRDRQDLKVVDFLTAADGVTTLDSTDLDFDQTVHAVVRLVRDTVS